MCTSSAIARPAEGSFDRKNERNSESEAVQARLGSRTCRPVMIWLRTKLIMERADDVAAKRSAVSRRMLISQPAGRRAERRELNFAGWRLYALACSKSSANSSETLRRASFSALFPDAVAR